MKLHTILLVACLTTVPAVAAENGGCSQTDEGLSCEGSVTMPDNSEGNGEACKPLVFELDIKIMPYTRMEPHLECIT